MNNIEKYHALHASLEMSQRVMEGIRAGAAAGKQFGLAAFAWYEASERRDYAMQVARHLEGHGSPVKLMPLPAPATEFDTALDAMELACDIDSKTMDDVDRLVSSIMQEGDDPYFMLGLKGKLEHDLEEIKEVKGMVRNATPDQMLEVNRRLLEKYSGK